MPVVMRQVVGSGGVEEGSRIDSSINLSLALDARQRHVLRVQVLRTVDLNKSHGRKQAMIRDCRFFLCVKIQKRDFSEMSRSMTRGFKPVASQATFIHLAVFRYQRRAPGSYGHCRAHHYLPATTVAPGDSVFERHPQVYAQYVFVYLATCASSCHCKPALPVPMPGQTPSVPPSCHESVHTSLCPARMPSKDFSYSSPCGRCLVMSFT
jgi:hypothetical protein